MKHNTALITICLPSAIQCVCVCVCPAVSYYNSLSRFDHIQFSQTLQDFADCLFTQRSASWGIVSSSSSSMLAVLVFLPLLCPRQFTTCAGVHENKQNTAIASGVNIWSLLHCLHSYCIVLFPFRSVQSMQVLWCAIWCYLKPQNCWKYVG